MSVRVKRDVLAIVLGRPNLSNTRTSAEGTEVYHLTWACGCTGEEHDHRHNTFFLTACARHAGDFAVAREGDDAPAGGLSS